MLVSLIESVEWNGKKQRAATPDSDLFVASLFAPSSLLAGKSTPEASLAENR